LPGAADCANNSRFTCRVFPMAKQPRALKMLTHGQVWGALDRLAERAGLSPSGLARRAGLDPTTFNKSKRITPGGRERWPSTESLAKALAATGSSIDTFVQLIGDHGRDVQSAPLLALSEAVRRGDRVVVETVAGEVLIGELKRRTAKTLELAPLDGNGQDRTLASDDVAWIARIVWRRQ
jgi:phage repressor protein C with HTH and peptisase S24 domain